MAFIDPMLAHKMPKKRIDVTSGQYAAEEKYDGIRVIIEVVEEGGASLFDEGRQAICWSRYGNRRPLPEHIDRELRKFPGGVYDGEMLVPGKRSYGTMEIANGPDLVLYIFDVLMLDGNPIHQIEYDSRRGVLIELFKALAEPPDALTTAVRLAESTVITSETQLAQMLGEVWGRDGEGLILKRRAAKYSIGKRTRDFIKLKNEEHAVLTITGFMPSRGTVMNRGDYATVLLIDDQGNEASVKTLNNAELAKFEAEAENAVMGRHPAIGRKLRIAYQERTPDGGYRHPRWHQDQSNL